MKNKGTRMRRFLARGYFPDELPPPFNTRAFATFVTATAPPVPYTIAKGAEPKFKSRPVPYNLARAGALRRPLAIPNPVNFYQLVGVIEALWPQLEKLYAKTDRALSRPERARFSKDNRAFAWAQGFNAIPDRRAEIRVGMRYGLRTDIKNFYPSIYTHSIPWALHGKEKSQANPGYYKLAGNKIDRLIQNAQLKQTKGIPIGPDSSYLAAEIILTKLDKQLEKELGTRFFRYVDDYEFAFRSFEEAEKGLGRFQEVLSSFELTANDSKTRIFELPQRTEELWPRAIRVMPLREASSPNVQRTHLLDIFDVSIDLRNAHPDQGIVKYAAAKTAGSVVADANWKLYQELLLMWAQAEPAVLPVVLDILMLYFRSGRVVDNDQLAEVLYTQVQLHSPRGHTSEVAWALWGHLLFSIPLEPTASSTVRRIDNSVVALLALNARARGLIAPTAAVSLWANHMSAAELTQEHWLLAYEARLKGWLPSLTGKNYIQTAVGFAPLTAAKVSFYDDGRASTYSPSSPRGLRKKLAALAAAAAGYPL